MKNVSLSSTFSKMVFMLSMVISCVSFVSCAESNETPITNYVDSASTSNYIVSTKAIVNIHDYASESSEVVQQVEYGNMLNAQVVEGSGWAKVYKDSEVLGYIKSEHIEAKQLYAKGGTYSQYKYFDPNNAINYLIFLVYALAVYVIFSTFSSSESILAMITQGFVLPILCYIYFRNSGDALWVCRPSIVGWWIAVPCFITIVVLAGIFLGTLIGGVKSILRIFHDPISAIIAIVAGLLAGSAMMQIVAEIFIEFTWVVLILLLGASGSSSTFIGTFTDRDGNSVDVHVR